MRRSLGVRANGARQMAHSSMPAAVVQWQQMRIRRLVGTASSNAPAAATAEPAAAAPAAAAPAAAPAASALDIRVGRVLSCARHPDPEVDSLYVEQVECGDAEGPRTIVSGLVKYVPLEAMQGRRVVVLANLKERNMRGVKSKGMLLCASNADHTAVEPLAPPEGAAVGERAWFGEGGKEQPAPAEPNRVQKKKIWEALQPDLKTDGSGVANFKGEPMLTSAGAITAATLTNASIS